MGALVARILLAVVVGAVVAVTAAWGSLALWYRLPDPQIARAGASFLFLVLGLATIVLLFGRFRWISALVYAAVFGGLLVWWSAIHPPAEGDWAPEVARQVTGVQDGDLLTLTNVRNFEWRSQTDFAEQWETRSYDLSKIQTLDLFMSYWAGPKIAHVIMSFGFEGHRYLAWSIEVKRTKGGVFSPVADLFKHDPLVILAADERDVVRVRSNVRGEDVQLYRLNASPDRIRALLLEYVADANALATTPEFYNSITTNCTTTIVKLMRAVGNTVPFDWRLLVNGYLPDYAYDRGALDSSSSLDALRAASHIRERARAADMSPSFSNDIRAAVPAPH